MFKNQQEINTEVQFSVIALEGHRRGIGLLWGKPGVLRRGEGNAQRLPASFQAVPSPAGYWLFMSTAIPSSFKYMNKQTNKNKSKTAWNLAGVGRGNFNVSFVSVQMTSEMLLWGVPLQTLLQSNRAVVLQCPMAEQFAADSGADSTMQPAQSAHPKSLEASICTGKIVWVRSGWANLLSTSQCIGHNLCCFIDLIDVRRLCLGS